MLTKDVQTLDSPGLEAAAKKETGKCGCSGGAGVELMWPAFVKEFLCIQTSVPMYGLKIVQGGNPTGLHR